MPAPWQVSPQSLCANITSGASSPSDPAAASPAAPVASTHCLVCAIVASVSAAASCETGEPPSVLPPAVASPPLPGIIWADSVPESVGCRISARLAAVPWPSLLAPWGTPVPRATPGRARDWRPLPSLAASPSSPSPPASLAPPAPPVLYSSSLDEASSSSSSLPSSASRSARSAFSEATFSLPLPESDTIEAARVKSVASGSRLSSASRCNTMVFCSEPDTLASSSPSSSAPASSACSTDGRRGSRAATLHWPPESERSYIELLSPSSPSDCCRRPRSSALAPASSSSSLSDAQSMSSNCTERGDAGAPSSFTPASGPPSVASRTAPRISSRTAKTTAAGV
mmetsp:Transcript_7713/g.23549  ORF Transcript_7713/g.23549 Transcript_7713/m.23549 type:complete len:342 (+) Transcript_7713:90-1115(+)